MALKKETDISKIEVVGKWNIQVRTDTIIKEDDTEVYFLRRKLTIEI